MPADLAAVQEQEGAATVQIGLGQAYLEHVGLFRSLRHEGGQAGLEAGEAFLHGSEGL